MRPGASTGRVRDGLFLGEVHNFFLNVYVDRVWGLIEVSSGANVLDKFEEGTRNKIELNSKGMQIPKMDSSYIKRVENMLKILKFQWLKPQF